MPRLEAELGFCLLTWKWFLFLSCYRTRDWWLSRPLLSTVAPVWGCSWTAPQMKSCWYCSLWGTPAKRPRCLTSHGSLWIRSWWLCRQDTGRDLLEGDAPHSFLLFLLGVQAALSLGAPPPWHSTPQGWPLCARRNLCTFYSTLSLRSPDSDSVISWTIQSKRWIGMFSSISYPLWKCIKFLLRTCPWFLKFCNCSRKITGDFFLSLFKNSKRKESSENLI